MCPVQSDLSRSLQEMARKYNHTFTLLQPLLYLSTHSTDVRHRCQSGLSGSRPWQDSLHTSKAARHSIISPHRPAAAMWRVHSFRGFAVKSVIILSHSPTTHAGTSRAPRHQKIPPYSCQHSLQNILQPISGTELPAYSCRQS